MKYWKVNENTIRFDDLNKEVAGIVTSEDLTGRWKAYLAWVAEGNTPEEWSPDGNQ
jgi:hypothetical protein